MQKSIQNASKQYGRCGSSMIFERFVDIQSEVARSNTPVLRHFCQYLMIIIVPKLKLGKLAMLMRVTFREKEWKFENPFLKY